MTRAGLSSIRRVALDIFHTRRSLPRLFAATLGRQPRGALSPDVYLMSRLWDAGGRRKPGSLVMSKILLAEDDIDMRRFLVKALQNA
jgi:hypothetical protein